MQILIDYHYILLNIDFLNIKRMKKKLNEIKIKKISQRYILEIIKAYPKINSGRKNYHYQYKRVLKKILMAQANKIALIKKKELFSAEINFNENNKFLLIKFRI